MHVRGRRHSSIDMSQVANKTQIAHYCSIIFQKIDSSPKTHVDSIFPTPESQEELRLRVLNSFVSTENQLSQIIIRMQQN